MDAASRNSRFKLFKELFSNLGGIFANTEATLVKGTLLVNQKHLELKKKSLLHKTVLQQSSCSMLECSRLRLVHLGDPYDLITCSSETRL